MKYINIILKRLFDIVFSLIGLLFLSPILLVYAVLIKIKMPDGPVVFVQERIGKNGSPFRMFKLRSMIVQNSPNTISISTDKRITNLGHHMRKYKIDELPELINVLLGDMSLVGPRPDVPGYADKLLGENRKILELRPGITGPASLAYANEEEILSSVKNPQKFNDEVLFPDKVKINLDYYYRHNFMLDLKIIVKTIIRKY